MAKLLLLSVIIGMIGIPMLMARDRRAKHGLKELVILMLGFNLFYLFAIRYIYPHLQ